jgi:hypothetical protein
VSLGQVIAHDTRSVTAPSAFKSNDDDDVDPRVDLVISQRFVDIQDGERTVKARDSAIAWARDWRADIEKGGND